MATGKALIETTAGWMGRMKRTMIIASVASGLYASPTLGQVRVVDQSNVDPMNQQNTIVSSSPDRQTTGQSFTPSLPGIQFASFDARNQFPFVNSNGMVVSPNMSVDYSVSLYSGFGTFNSNTFIAKSNITTIPANTSRQTTYFNFANFIPLTPSQTYTLVINDEFHIANPGVFDDASFNSGNDSYAGGQFILSSSADMYFSEGIFQAAAPEPGLWALMILGFGIVGYVMRRRKVSFGSTPVANSLPAR